MGTHYHNQLRLKRTRRRQTTFAAYCLMPNHWHLLLWPKRDGELSEVVRWITVTHTQRLNETNGETIRDEIHFTAAWTAEWLLNDRMAWLKSWLQYPMTSYLFGEARMARGTT